MFKEGGFSERASEDLLLVERAKQHDQKAYDILMSRYKMAVYHLILKMIKNEDDAEDLTIEAFAKAFLNIYRYNGEYAFSTWLFRIATSNTIDFIRKKKLNTTSIDQSIETDSDDAYFPIQLSDTNPNPQQRYILKQKIELLRMIVANLPEKYQRLVKLRYFKEYAYEDIAEKLDIPLGTVKAQLYRARELLYKMIKNKKDHF